MLTKMMTRAVAFLIERSTLDQTRLTVIKHPRKKVLKSCTCVRYTANSVNKHKRMQFLCWILMNRFAAKEVARALQGTLHASQDTKLVRTRASSRPHLEFTVIGSKWRRVWTFQSCPSHRRISPVPCLSYT